MTSESLNTWASTMAGTTPTMLHMENTPATRVLRAGGNWSTTVAVRPATMAW
nr:hypothetical protein [Nonomuraea sp. WAC 01424]